MLGKWSAGQVGIKVALLAEEAQTVQLAQGHKLTGSQFCDLVNSVCVELADFLSEDGVVPRLLIAHLDD